MNPSELNSEVLIKTIKGYADLNKKFDKIIAKINRRKKRKLNTEEK